MHTQIHIQASSPSAHISSKCPYLYMHFPNPALAESGEDRRASQAPPCPKQILSTSSGSYASAHISKGWLLAHHRALLCPGLGQPCSPPHPGNTRARFPGVSPPMRHVLGRAWGRVEAGQGPPSLGLRATGLRGQVCMSLQHPYSYTGRSPLNPKTEGHPQR